MEERKGSVTVRDIWNELRRQWIMAIDTCINRAWWDIHDPKGKTTTTLIVHEIPREQGGGATPEQLPEERTQR